MLRFPIEPSAAALHLVTKSLEYAVFSAHMCDESDWELEGSFVSRCFPRELAISTMKAMVRHLARDEVYRVTDYHWLLLREAIDTLVEIAGDDSECELLDGLAALATEDDTWFIGNGGGCTEIDLVDFEVAYFWDLDFTMDDNGLSRMSPIAKELFRASGETWGVAQGLVPHSSELAFEVSTAPWRNEAS